MIIQFSWSDLWSMAYITSGKSKLNLKANVKALCIGLILGCRSSKTQDKQSKIYHLLFAGQTVLAKAIHVSVTLLPEADVPMYL